MRAIAVATAAVVGLIALYLALGGASYAPAKVADPCAPREWRNPQGLQEVAEQIVLSGLDGAACELRVSREQIVLAFAGRDSLERFAREHRISEERLEELVRSGLLRAVDDAEQAGALNAAVADLLRGLVPRIPISSLLDLLQQLPGLSGLAQQLEREPSPGPVFGNHPDAA
jgi:AcrR family transcriptional regulator